MSYGYIKTFNMKSRYEKLSDFYLHKKLPSNIRDYENLGKYEELCPFCEEPHHNYQVHVNGLLKKMWDTANEDYDNEQYDTEVDWSSFYMCEDCQTVYQTVEWKAHTSNANQEELEGETQLAEESKNRSNERITAYLEERILYKAEEWVKDPFSLTHCFFCRGRINPNKEWNTAKMWVPEDTDSVGGEIQVCWECDEKIGHDHFLHSSSLKQEACSKCSSIYPITIEEYTDRLNGKTIGEHLCPSCIFNLYKTWNISRWINIYCKECGELKNKNRHSTRIADRTLNDTVVNSGGEYTCSDCQIAKSFIFFTAKGSPIEFWMGITPYGEDGLFTCAIYKCNTKGILEGSTILASCEPGEVDEVTIWGRSILIGWSGET